MHIYKEIIGTGKAMRKIFSLMEIVANSNCTVLIEGESGVGKELVSRGIHYNSSRKDQPLIIQNCSGLNENLLESELFGHVKGSFTGAIRDKKGLFEVADKGTFFLDEIADMSPALQVKLLRVLQEGTFTKVGSTQTRKVDVRIIASTNKKLETLIEQQKFREDLYYRLNVISIEIPPLRKRKEDIPALINHFLEKFVNANQKSRKSLSGAALEILLEYHWPGNVRELEKETERLVVMSGDKDLITEDPVSPRIRQSFSFKAKRINKECRLKDAIADLEKDMISEALLRNNWNKSKSAKDLGISRVCLLEKICNYSLQNVKQNDIKTYREVKVKLERHLNCSV